MKKWLGLLLSGVVLSWSASATAAQRGTPAEAKAMLAKAIAHYASVGRKQALADFTGRKVPFFDRDLYVVCLGADDTVVAHGGYATFVGQSVDLLRDAERKPLGRALWAAAGAANNSVQYVSLNPVSNKAEPKVSFVQKAGNDLCLVGAYNPR